jgi:AAA+ superfamily predicted ATPase
VDWVIFYDCGWTAKTETTKPVAPKITNGFILAKWVQGYWKNPKIKAEMA